MSDVEKYYDEFSTHQLSIDINARHRSIAQRALVHGLKSNSKVLEIGCGIGTVTQLIAEKLRDGKITAIDISPKSIEIAQNRLKHLTNVSFKAADITQTDIKEKYDFILLPDVIEHIPIEQHPKLFKQLASLLSENGIIFIHIPNPDYLVWETKHNKENLQIIDQPIYTSILCDSIKDTDLYIHFLETYSIWVEQCDYQAIILKKSPKKFNKLEFNPTFFQKVKFKLKSLF